MCTVVITSEEFQYEEIISLLVEREIPLIIIVANNLECIKLRLNYIRNLYSIDRILLLYKQNQTMTPKPKFFSSVSNKPNFILEPCHDSALKSEFPLIPFHTNFYAFLLSLSPYEYKRIMHVTFLVSRDQKEDKNIIIRKAAHTTTYQVRNEYHRGAVYYDCIYEDELNGYITRERYDKEMLKTLYAIQKNDAFTSHDELKGYTIDKVKLPEEKVDNVLSFMPHWNKGIVDNPTNRKDFETLKRIIIILKERGVYFPTFPLQFECIAKESIVLRLIQEVMIHLQNWNLVLELIEMLDNDRIVEDLFERSDVTSLGLSTVFLLAYIKKLKKKHTEEMEARIESYFAPDGRGAKLAQEEFESIEKEMKL